MNWNPNSEDAGQQLESSAAADSYSLAGIEPERYELFESPRYEFQLDRRDFLRQVGSGIVVCILMRDAAAEQQPGQRRSQRGSGGRAPQDIGSWLHVSDDGSITIYTGKVEIGQNIRTSLAQAAAEELRAPIEMIQVVMADTQRVPFDAGTFGSQTTPSMSRQIRRAAAAARELLIDLAAESWQVNRDSLRAVGGKIVHQETNRAVEFGALTKGKRITQSIAGDAATTEASRWQVAGRSVPKVGGRAIVTGRHKYASDMALPGMLHGRVLRPGTLGATLASADTSAAEALPDVVVVRDGEFVGVAAPSEFQASQALGAIKADWVSGAQISGRDLFQQLKQPAGGAARPGGRRDGGNRVGSVSEGLEKADIRLEQTYTVAYIAHAPLEPRAAAAEWHDGKLTVWTGTQRPFGVRGDLAGAFRISEENVRVIVPDMGSGYGGKHQSEAATEAARLAKAAGKPVKVVWTREEEFTWAYFRPAGVIDVKSGVRKDGSLTAWEFHNYNSGGSSIRTLYDVPNQFIEFHSARSPLRQGSYRALAATANVFARETHMDELAHALAMDPLEFRLKNLKDERLRAVLQAAAAAFGWGKKVESHGGVGIAAGSEKGSYVATCAEVALDRPSGRVKVVRATTAFECGAIVNPEHLKNQVEGAVVMGLGGALFEAIQFENGKILNPHFSQYRVPRFADTPELEVVLLDRKDLPSAGAGETPIVGIAPAIGNAIFSATGMRLRALPLVPRGVAQS
jgi:isoquinoline 1-oxidoreductase